MSAHSSSALTLGPGFSWHLAHLVPKHPGACCEGQANALPAQWDGAFLPDRVDLPKCRVSFTSPCVLERRHWLSVFFQASPERGDLVELLGTS